MTGKPIRPVVEEKGADDMARKSRTSQNPDHRHAGRAAAGKGAKGSTFDPTGPEGMAPGADLANDRPRPSPTRYPVAHEEFLRLKQSAEVSKAKVAKKGSTVVRDTAKPSTSAQTASAVAEAGVPMSAAPSPTAPAMLTSFAGISATGWFPPDCTLAAGPNHVLVSVNSSVALYPTSGGAAVFTKSLTAWFSSVISSAKIFDPKALFDQHAGRWVLLADALGPGAHDSFFLLSISKTANPAGQWWNYKLDASKDGTTSTLNWADFPGLGVDNQALYITANMFKFGGGFAYVKLRVIPKAAPYAGGPMVYKDLVKLKLADGSPAFTVQPCHTFGAPNVEYLVGSKFPSGNALTLWRLSNVLTAPTLVAKGIPVTPYSLPPDAAQKGGGTPLDSGDVRVLNAVFRGGAVWCGLTTAHNFGGGNVSAVQWFQLNATSGALIQQGVYGANGFHYFYPAITPDSNGNMHMVFSRSGATEFAASRFSGRRATAPLGVVQPSALLKAGTANYTNLDSGGRNRWGDYAGIGCDPMDPLRAWIYTLHAVTANKWGTQVGAVKF